MEWALLVASIALVGVTVVYTVFTWLMVDEMRKTRLLSVTPELVLSMRM
jgi:hypothetical protein